jgi:opacity protein-like surface antigen
MRLSVVFMLGTLASSGVASAQSAPPPASKGYVEGVAQSALSNVTSQSFGGELGVTVMPNVQVFVEAGMVHNVATPDISTSAQQIAGALSQTQTNVLYSVKQPVTFGVAGVKYVVPMTGKAQPYLMGGGGLAKVKQDVTFTVGGTDVTGNLSQGQYGNITLGSDLSGSFTKPMFVVGGGVAWPVWQQVVIDFQYRYGRIFADDGGISVSRAGIGIGVHF